jgi:hypothetical protein
MLRRARHHFLSLGAAFAGALAVACGAAGSQALADSVCGNAAMKAAAVYGSISSVSGAFQVSAAELADWQETRHGPDGPQDISPWRRAAPATSVTVCFYDGVFPNFPAPPPLAKALPYDRFVLIVGPDGSTTMYVVGNHTTLAVERPQRK